MTEREQSAYERLPEWATITLSCIVCSKCGFAWDADHSDVSSGVERPTYTCPECYTVGRGA